MTIFCKVTTDFLIQGLKSIIQSSYENDKGILTLTRDRTHALLEDLHARTGLGFFDVRRDTTLSQEKRERLELLIETIQQIHKTQTNTNQDDDTFGQLDKALQVCFTDISALASKKQKASGTTEKSLMKLRSLLEQIHIKICSTFKLKNVSFDNAIPLHCLQYYSIKARSHYLYEEHVNLLWQDIQLIEEKQALMLTQLKYALEDCPVIDAPNVKRLARERAEAIMRENDTINTHYRLRLGGSLMNTDHVKQCMLEVIDQLSFKPDIDFDEELAPSTQTMECPDAPNDASPELPSEADDGDLSMAHPVTVETTKKKKKGTANRPF